jgi:hypothetical protein
MALRQGLDREHTKRMWQDALAQRCDRKFSGSIERSPFSASCGASLAPYEIRWGPKSAQRKHAASLAGKAVQTQPWRTKALSATWVAPRAKTGPRIGLCSRAANRNQKALALLRINAAQPRGKARRDKAGRKDAFLAAPLEARAMSTPLQAFSKLEILSSMPPITT